MSDISPTNLTTKSNGLHVGDGKSTLQQESRIDANTDTNSSEKNKNNQVNNFDKT